MFGILRPCRNRLGEQLRASWTAHLCGMCLALRDEHGHLARVVTNYDAVVISALVEAQTGPDGRRRQAGPCALRGLRAASVATGDGARLAASVSLLLAVTKLRDHVADGDLDGALRTRAAVRVADRFARAGRTTGESLVLDSGALLEVAARQPACEATARSILDVTAPTEAATALAFEHTALVAGRPDNAAALGEAGRLFGRLAHLLDAVEDLHRDRSAGAWNPITAFGLGPAQVRRLCEDAGLGIRLALRDVEFADTRLVHALLVHEVGAAIERTFTHAGAPPPQPPQPPPITPPLPPEQQPDGQPPPGWGEQPPEWGRPPERPGAKAANPFAACAGWLVACGTCQVCCANEWTNPCTGQRHEGACRGDCGGCDCCCDGDGCGACCDCCDCCGDCDCDCGC